MKKLSKFNEEAYALMRILMGFMFTFHGLQKVLGILADPAQMPHPGSQIWIGGLIELVCGPLILIGFQTRIAAFLASGMMAVAYMQFHWQFRFDANFFPIVNHGELAVIYCFVLLLIATRGGGKWSLEGKIGKP